MEIRSLVNPPFEDLIACTLEAFSDYFVKMPSDLNYWRFRLKAARRMVDQFAGPTELVEVPGGKLFVHEEYPEVFAKEVLDHFTAAFDDEDEGSVGS